MSRMIQRELADIFIREGTSFCSNAMLTVTGVRMSSDFSYARVYVSLFATKNKDNIISVLNKHASEVRHILGKRIRNQVRKLPELSFFLDDSIDYEERIDNLLNN